MIAAAQSASRGPSGSTRCTLATLALASLCGCATSERNYLEPGAPRYEGQHAPLAPAPKATIRVVTYNVEYGLRVPAAIEALQRYAPLGAPDVLLLQEMDAPGTEAVASALHLNYVYYPSSRAPRTHRDVGTAILSPWPLEAAAKVQLPHLSRITRHSRAVTAADVRIDGRTVRVYSVHVCTLIGLGPQKRREQLEAILADVESHPGPVIVGGDFNDKKLAARVAARGFAWPTRTIGRTTALFSFDHILARGLEPVEAEPDAGVTREAKAGSDHRPVWALFAAR